MPMSAAASGLNANARIAMPIFVLSTMNRNASSKTKRHGENNDLIAVET